MSAQTSSGLSTWIATTSTRYAIGIAANSPSAALHGRARRARAGAARERHEQPRQQRAGDEHGEHVERPGEHALVAAGRLAPRERATS